MAKTKLHIIYIASSLWGPFKARVGNGVSGSYMYMDAIFKLVVHEKSEIWTSLPHSFTKGGLLQLPG